MLTYIYSVILLTKIWKVQIIRKLDFRKRKVYSHFACSFVEEHFTYKVKFYISQNALFTNCRTKF